MFHSASVYLDSAATTPTAPEIEKIMRLYQRRRFYNPSALYSEAVLVRKDIEERRSGLAKVMRVPARGVLFTGGATEANNVIIQGVVWRAKQQGIERPHIIMSATEHPSVRETVRQLANRGLATFDEVSVSSGGVVEVKHLKTLITKETVLVTVHVINNETGVIQPLREIAKTVRWARKQNQSEYPYLHADAAQAASYHDLSLPQLGVDAVTLSSQKCHGPKGLGVVVHTPNLVFASVLGGGSQEAGYRPGTENVPAIIGGCTALERAILSRERVFRVVKDRRRLFIQKLRELFPVVQIHGHDQSGESQSPHIVSFTIPGMSAELLVIELAERGVLVAARAACSADDTEPSHVLAAMYEGHTKRDNILTTGAVRVSFSKYSTRRDVRKAIQALAHIKAKYMD